MFYSNIGVNSARSKRSIASVPAVCIAGSIQDIGSSFQRSFQFIHRLARLAIVGLLVSAGMAVAQTTVSTTAPDPVGETVDASGAVYYISRSATNVILKATLSGGTYTETTALTAASYASGNIVVDGSGNLYFISNGGVVKETLAAGTYTESTIAPPGTFTTGLTIDGSGNLYGTTTTGITKLTLSSGTYTAAPVITGESNPYGVAVDTSGNLYISIPNQGNSTVLKETLSAGTYTESTLASGLVASRGIAVDALGNVYFSDLTHIYKAVPSSDGYTTRLFGVFDGSAATVPQPEWIALDPSGSKLYLEGAINGQAPLLAFATSSTDPAGLQFGSMAAGSTNTETLTYTFAAATTLGSYQVTTQGVTSLDFVDAGGGTCTPGASYAAAATCTIVVTFAPKHAGARSGAVTLFDNSGTVIEYATLTGTAIGPQVALLPATLTQVVPTSTYVGIAADDNGTVYLADLANTRVLKETPTGTGTYTESIIASGLLGPQGIAIDGAGNVFITDNDRTSGSYGLGIALKFTPEANGTYAQTTLATGLSFSGGIAVDGSGNVYINDNGASGTPVIRLELLPGGRYSQTEIINNAGYGGLAVDPSGIIYIEEVQNGVSRYTPGAMGVYTADAFSDGNVSTSGSIAVDRSGDVYIAGFGAGDEPQVSRVKANSDGTYSMSYAAGSGIITVDGSGNIYGIGSAYSDLTGVIGGVFRADQNTPPTLTFPQTAVGSTYEIPIPVQFVNIGNAPLNFVAPASGTNLSVSANFIVEQNYQSDFCPQVAPGSPAGVLAPGAECRAFVNFAPTVSGPITGTLTATDDNLNVPGATQVIHLNGTGTGGSNPTVTLTWPTPAPITSGTPLGGVQLDATANVPGTFVYTPPAGTVLSSGTHTLSVTFTPTDTTTYSAATATVQILVTTSSVTITWPTPAPIVYGTALSATQLDATASVPGTFVYTPAAGAVLSAGVQTLSVAFTPTDTATYGPATATVQLVVTQAVPALQWSTPDPITYGTALSATQLNATASVPGTFVYTPAAGAIPPVGQQTLSVAFTPTDAIDYAAASATVTLTVTPSSLDFTFTNSGAFSQTILPGKAGSFTFALAPVSGVYPGSVTFTVAGLPAGAAYSITPSPVDQAAGPQTETLTVQTGSPVIAVNSSVRSSGGSVLPPVFLSLSLIPLSLIGLRKRIKASMARWLALVVVSIATIAGCAAISGCGTNNGFLGVAPKNYTITVTASSGSIEHSASVTLNVQ
jgi:hypothetical protein